MLPIITFLKNPIVQKGAAGISIFLLAWTLHYNYHTKPMNELRDDRDRLQTIVDKAKKKVDDSKKENETFEDKWKKEKENASTGTTKPVESNEINTTVGEHNISV